MSGFIQQMAGLMRKFPCEYGSQTTIAGLAPYSGLGAEFLGVVVYDELL